MPTLANSTEYYLIWDANVVKDLANNPVAAQASTTLWSFTTAAAGDVTPPTVVSFSPLDDATGVAVSANLVATLSETVTLGAAGVITLKKTSDNSTVDSWNVATAGGSTAGKVEVVGGTQLTMHLTVALANSLGVYVVWDAGVVKDAANNPIAANAATTLWNFTTVAAAGTFLLDLYPTASMAYSFRKLRNAYAGSAVRIRRSSDNLEANIGFDGSGNFDTAAAATHIGGGSGFIVTWFDQSGNAVDVTQATAANQPGYLATGMNSKPAADFDQVNDVLNSASIANTALPLATTTIMSVMLEDNAGVNASIGGWEAVSQTNRFGFLNPYNGNLFFDFGSNSPTLGEVSVAKPANWNTNGHVFEAGRDASGSQFMTLDGVELIRGSGRTVLPSAGSAAFSIGAAFGVRHNGQISEFVIWAAELAANRTAARGNVQTYWATPTLLLDVLGVTATRAYSTRKLRSAYAGSAIRIRRSSDNAEQDIGFVSENLDTAAITTFVGANSAFVVRYYDQSGNADNVVQATVANQPRIVNAGVLDVRNTKACPRFDGVDDIMASTASFTVAEGGSLVATADAGPNFPIYYGAVTETANTSFLVVGTGSGSSYYTAGMLSSLAVNNGANAAVFGGVLQQIDSVCNTPVTFGVMQFGSDRPNLRFWPGWIGEAVTFAAALSAGNRTAMYTNQKTYWGTP